MTVTGTVRDDELGVTAMHEHLLLDLARVSLRPHERLVDVGEATREVESFRLAGGSTIVELTSRELGRDPDGLRAISKATGVQVVMGCGWYIDLYFTDEIRSQSASAVGADIVSEIENGVGSTGVRPGIIGEIGAHTASLTPDEVKSLRAAAHAHHSTGLTISMPFSLR